MPEFFDPRAQRAIESMFQDIGFGIRGIYDRAGRNFAAGFRGIGDAGLQVGKHLVRQNFGPRRFELPRQDRSAISFQRPASGSIRPGNFSVNRLVKPDVKRRVARKRLARKRRAAPRRRGR
jgi:hypothetical protein